MENKKIFLNLFIVMFSIGSVFFIRMESRKTSYVLQKKFEVLKDRRKSHRTLMAKLNTNGGESLYKNSEKMVAYKTAKSQQIVMVSDSMMVSN